MATTELNQAVPSSPVRRGPGWTLWFFRFAAIVATLLVVAQPVIAGLYLGGEYDALGAHRIIGTAVLGATSVVQLVAAALYVWIGRGSGRPLVAAVVFLAGFAGQLQIGLAGVLSLHVPLGVLLVLIEVLLLCWLFTTGAARPRVSRSRVSRGARR